MDEERRYAMRGDTHVTELFTAEELQGILKLKSIAAVRRWTVEGCPVIKLGRLRRYRLEDMLRWLEQRAA
jgi:phage terminase Nu1 subunit (DNA packaging protein)